MICKYYERGHCYKGNACSFKHEKKTTSVSEDRNKEKTKICKYFEKGYCQNGQNCQFLHTTVDSLIKQICGYPAWEIPQEKVSNPLTIKLVGGFSGHSDGSYTKFGYEITLNGINIDKRIYFLKKPIFSRGEDLLTSLLDLKKRSEEIIDTDNEDLFIVDDN